MHMSMHNAIDLQARVTSKTKLPCAVAFLHQAMMLDEGQDVPALNNDKFDLLNP